MDNKNKRDIEDKNANEKIDQLSKAFNEPGEFLTNNQGVRVSDNQNTLKAGERGPSLLEDQFFREKITHFDHERIPERVVHARGSAAHGYFQVYESLADYTKAKFLQDPSVKTPVFVRFSTVLGFRGSADTVRDVRGFATRFYTEEGNFDLVGNNIPVFFIQDAIKFPDIIHAGKPQPLHEMPQASTAHDNFWDFISLTPESMHMIMWVLSDRALPRSYSTMEGFGIHTFRFINEEGKSRFVKFHWKPINGIYSLLFEETQIIAGKDPDFNRRDLWESIEMGNYPEFELGVQVLEEDELEKVEFDILDPTKIWPEEDIPVRKIGKMTLNRNPDNFFAETEQVAFHPGNIVSGIDFTNDPLLQGRLFSYIDTQLTRLGGPNFHEIPINRPIAPVHNNQRDGFMRQTINKGNVNYEPNSLGKGCPMQALWSQGGFASFPQKMSGEKVRKRPESFGDHYSQASLFWNSMSDAEKRHMIKGFHFELGKVQYMHIREKMVEHLNRINHALAIAVAEGIGVEPPTEDRSNRYNKSSPALSMDNHKTDSIKGRKVAVLAANGADYATIEKLIDLLEDEGATVKVIANRIGMLKAEDGQDFEIEQSYAITSSVLFDAVFVAGGKEIANQGDAIHFVNEAYRHCKPIGAIGEGVKLLQASSIKAIKFAGQGEGVSSELGIITAGKGIDIQSFFDQFKEALAKLRFWEREEKDQSQIPA
ncbi:catalase [Candidatus Protochlamydia phocaeensis]|uniref:catalase n=1 Tax=Candidatus Protochlamydia phocaeensis TaxID=1414722 RepID=UPI000A4EBB98|nr:catalase [Candidatus Protochlamydia phocaeensis]